MKRAKPKRKLKAGLGKLALSIIVDTIGMTSYSFPLVGEISDAVWAPISAILIFWMYGDLVGAGVGFVEEFATGTDIIPTATLMWFYVNRSSLKLE